MKCDEVRILLDPLIDDELPANEFTSVKAHTDDCADCSRELDELTTLRRSLRSLPRPELPRSLRNEVIAIIDDMSKSGSVLTNLRWALPVLTHAGAALIGGLIVLGVTRMTLPPTPKEHEMIAAHVRSLMDERLTQVADSDTHKVKPWFAGKLNYSPIVVDLATEGFPLAGGRVDYLNDRKVAALVYMRREHKINLFVIPVSEIGSTETVRHSRNGFNLVGWRRRGFQFWAISDLSEKELTFFSKAVELRVD